MRIASHSIAAPKLSREIVVVTAADDNYAMPLAVTIRSALDSLSADCRLRLFVLDGGLTAESRDRLAASWADERLSLQWLQPDVARLRDLPVTAHIGMAAYLRLLMPELLPADVDRVLYLDADMLVRRDLGDLWNVDQQGQAALAVQDLAAPYLDADIHIPKLHRCRRYLAAATPVANFRDLGLPPDGMYFNSGLLAVDVALWRRDDVGGQVLQCLREHRRHVLWCDQYALNVVLAGKWGALDRRWNQGTQIYVYPNWRESWLDRAAFDQIRHDPWIVHFCSPTKPWHYFCRHPFTADFLQCLDQTDWRGWRPARPDNYLRQWWHFHYQPLRTHVNWRLRTVKRAIRSGRRAA